MHPNLKEITRNHLPILHNSQRCRSAIPEPPILAYRRSKNLRDLLVHSDIRTTTQLPPGFSKCGSTRGCNVCKYSRNTNNFQSNNTNNIYRITNHISCKSKNIIYIINCKRCNKQYVGETKTELRLRFNNHLSSIRRNIDQPVAIHFNEESHTIEDVEIIGIIKIMKQDDALRKKLESIWIKKLQTSAPIGLNTRI